MLAASLVVPPGCDTDGGRPDDASDSARSYSGEELLLGVFFMDGPVAELFPELIDEIRQRNKSAASQEEENEAQRILSQVPDPSDLSDEERAKLDELEGKILARIRAEDPTFFERFADDMQSGDHFLVDAALAEAAEHVKVAVAAELGVSPDELMRDPSAFRCAPWFAVAFVAVVAYAVTAVVAYSSFWVVY
ncbi:MAG TPA: hypothetical protein VFG69_09195 [Nannocystaceae bacterium]|nr:hypothetical protein [Nannocystaceae bacterium]